MEIIFTPACNVLRVKHLWIQLSLALPLTFAKSVVYYSMIVKTGRPTYELWYLGDIFNSRVKCRESLNGLLIEARELIVQGREAGLTVGGIEICCVSADGLDIETVFDFNFAN